MSTENSLSSDMVIYTDGCCKGNPGVGGWGAIIRYQNKTKEIFGGVKDTTNNRMELNAVIEALSFSKSFHTNIQIYTDSKYVKNGITLWTKSWIKSNWINSNKKPVKNKDLWTRLIKNCELNNKIVWNWVKGHNGCKLNERSDYLANLGVQKILKGINF